MDETATPARTRVAALMSQDAARLIDSLDDAQRKSALWPFPADDERRLWFYTPTDHGGLTLAAMTQSVSPEYAKEGRLFGNIWHRVVISLSMHAAWPFGLLQEMYPCLNSTRWDPVGWCVWQVWAGQRSSLRNA